jgi:hypothetical protein
MEEGSPVSKKKSRAMKSSNSSTIKDNSFKIQLKLNDKSDDISLKSSVSVSLRHAGSIESDEERVMVPNNISIED